MPDSPPAQPAIPAEAMLAQLPDAVVYSDRDGKILLWNAAAEKLFGFPAAETLGQSLDIIIPERFRRAHWAGFERAVAAGKVRHEGEVRLTRAIHKDGRKLYIEVAFGLINAADGAVLGVIASARPGAPPPRPAAPPTPA